MARYSFAAPARKDTETIVGEVQYEVQDSTVSGFKSQIFRGPNCPRLRISISKKRVGLAESVV